MKKTLVLLLVLVLVLSLVACNSAKKEEMPKEEGTETEKPKEETEESSGDKILTLTKNADLNNMDPQVATDGLSFEAIAACMEGLNSVDVDGNAVPGIAESYEMSEDGLVYTFKLRDALWSNDAPVTANDFVYAWQRLADPEFGSEYAYMIDIAAVKNGVQVLEGKLPVEELGVKALDDKTFEVTLERPVPFFDTLVSFPSFYPTNKEFAEAQGDQYGLSPETTLYNGPFVWTEWFSGNNFKFAKNDKYYDKDVVKLDGVEFKVALDAQSAVLDYEAGNSDMVYLTGELVENYKDHPDYKIQLGSYLWWLQVNNNTDKFANQNLLKAIALAYNREQVAYNVLKDGAIPAYFFVPKKLAADTNGKDFRETSGDFFTEDKEKAKEYWAKAKEELGIDSFEFEILFEDSEQSKKVAEFLKSEIEGTLEGVTVNLKGQPKKTRLQIMRGTEDDYDLGLTRWGPDYADPMTYLELYAPSAGNTGRGGYENAKYSELIEKAKSGKLSTEERWQVMLDAEKLLLEEQVGPLPVYQTGKAELWNPKVKDVNIQSVGVPMILKYTYIED